MQNAVLGLETFMWVLPRADKDDPVDYAKFTEANADLDGLVNLGLLENITEGSRIMLDTIQQAHGRTFRVFRVTDLGRAFFQASLSSAVN